MSADVSSAGVCLYEVLGLGRLATAEEVRKAYLGKAMQWHPDKWVHAETAMAEHAESCFKLVVEANTILSDPSKRATYDALRARRSGASRPSTAQPANPFRPVAPGARSPYAEGPRASARHASESAPAERPATAAAGAPGRHAGGPAAMHDKFAAYSAGGAGGSASVGRPAQHQPSSPPRPSLHRDASAAPARRASGGGGASVPIAAEQSAGHALGADRPLYRLEGEYGPAAVKRRPHSAWRGAWPPGGGQPAARQRASTTSVHGASAPHSPAPPAKAFTYPAQSASVGGKLRPRPVAQRERPGTSASARIVDGVFRARSAVFGSDADMRSQGGASYHGIPIDRYAFFYGRAQAAAPQPSPRAAALDAAQSRYYDYFGRRPRAAAVGRPSRPSAAPPATSLRPPWSKHASS